MSDYHKNWQTFLINEAGLAKIRQDMLDFDTAFITAFRGDINDKSMCAYTPPPKDVSERSRMGRKGVTNRRNNKDLSAYILSRGYGLKNVQGSYIENFGSIDPEKIPREVKENSFFVVNLNNDPQFFDEIIDLGKRYCQDSVILVPKGGEAFLYGTNNTYPGLDQKETVGKFMGGETGEFMSRIGGRPFIMKEDEETKIYNDYSGKQRQAIKLMSKRVLGEIEEMRLALEDK
tara:strand:+ start:392 stop:1087 length:696 start_codon:yes stop_codon:yes gene_type:complete